MPLQAAGDLLVGEAAVDVAGHAPVQLRGVRLGPHHQLLRGSVFPSSCNVMTTDMTLNTSN